MTAPAVDWSKIPAEQQNDLKKGFQNYGKFGDRNFTGNNMTLKNADKWLKESQVLSKTITTTDTSIAFKQVVGNSTRVMTIEQFKKFLEKLSIKSKDKAQADLESYVSKLAAKCEPGTSGTTSTVKNSAVDRLTDISKYTGSHKERFDANTGKGKGKAGRVDEKEAAYVQGYKNSNTYDAKH